MYDKLKILVEIVGLTEIMKKRINIAAQLGFITLEQATNLMGDINND